MRKTNTDIKGKTRLRTDVAITALTHTALKYTRYSNTQVAQSRHSQLVWEKEVKRLG